MLHSSTNNCPLCDANIVSRDIVASSGTYRHCTMCDLVFQETAQLPERAEELSHYLTHDNRVDDPRYRKFLSQLAEPMMEQLSSSNEGLDFGAGPGPALAAMFTERGFPTAIYDPFFARDKTVLKRRYDFVTSTEVIEHLHKPRREFELFDHLLKPGGWLGLMTEQRSPSL